MNILRQKDVSHVDQLARKGRAGFYQRRVQAFQNVGVGFQRQADKLLLGHAGQ